MNDNTRQIPAKILVVDDEPDMVELVQRKFRKRIHDGLYAFLFAEDGYDALRAIESQPDIDLVITDINMPRMDGLTLLNHLNDAAPLMKSVIVSAYGDMENIRTAMNRGAFDFVTKPINFSDLEVTINKTLSEITALREAYQQRTAALRERGQLARYFPPAVADRLINDPSPLALNVERREMSFVFTDLAGFTPLIEKSDPVAVVPVLNDYFGGMVDIAFKHEGTIDKVVGDGIDVFFGAPIEQYDHAARAVACAMDMDEYAQAFAHFQRAKGVPVGETRIGINSGEALVGNFGCNALMHYTAYGDAVNTAARLQTANRAMGTRICVSEATASAIPGFNGLPIGQLALKGKSHPVMVYQPRRADTMDNDFSTAYLAAYQLLASEDDKALEAFSDIVDRHPDAHLAAFHLKRLRNGKSGIEIKADDG